VVALLRAHHAAALVQRPIVVLGGAVLHVRAALVVLLGVGARVDEAPVVRAAVRVRAALPVPLRVGARVDDAPVVRAALGVRVALLVLLRVLAVLALRLATGDQSRRPPWLESLACALPVLRVGAHLLAHARVVLRVRAVLAVLLRAGARRS